MRDFVAFRGASGPSVRVGLGIGVFYVAIYVV